MIVVMRADAGRERVEAVEERVRALGYESALTSGELQTIVAVRGDTAGDQRLEGLGDLPGVESLLRVQKAYKEASREFHPADTVVDVDGLQIGGNRVVMMVGPCAVESHEQLMAAAEAVKEAGFPVLRGGAFKPRSSPYSFQGLFIEGLRLLSEAREKTGLKIVTEVMSEMDVQDVAAYADIIQIGARTMHAFRLLERVADTGKPVLLKRGFHATIKEWLLAAEYILKKGNPNVILCERGIRSFDSEFARNVLDLTAIQVAKKESHLPVIADPSHGTGVRDYVIPMARAAVAAGADGLIIESHPNPAEALSDGPQSIPTTELQTLEREVSAVAKAVGRTL